MTKIPFPNVSFFASRSKKDSPYDKLYQHVAQKMNTTLKDMGAAGVSVMDIYLTEEDAVELDELVKQWIKHAHKFSKEELEKQYAYYHLDFSPGILQDKSKEKGYVYVITPKG